MRAITLAPSLPPRPVLTGFFTELPLTWRPPATDDAAVVAAEDDDKASDPPATGASTRTATLRIAYRRISVSSLLMLDGTKRKGEEYQQATHTIYGRGNPEVKVKNIIRGGTDIFTTRRRP